MYALFTRLDRVEINSRAPQSCVSLNGPADDADAKEFIDMAEAGYVPQILDVLNQTIAARAVFANDDFVAIILRDLIAYNISNTHYLANLTDAAPVCLVFYSMWGVVH